MEDYNICLILTNLLSRCCKCFLNLEFKFIFCNSLYIYIYILILHTEYFNISMQINNKNLIFEKIEAKTQHIYLDANSWPSQSTKCQSLRRLYPRRLNENLRAEILNSTIAKKIRCTFYGLYKLLNFHHVNTLCSEACLLTYSSGNCTVISVNFILFYF